MKKKSKKWYYILGSILLTFFVVLETVTGFFNNSFQIFDRIKYKTNEITIDSTTNSPSNSNSMIIKSNVYNKSVIRINDLVKEATDYKNRGYVVKANEIYWNAYNLLSDTLKNYNLEVKFRTESTEVQNNQFDSIFKSINIK